MRRVHTSLLAGLWIFRIFRIFLHSRISRAPHKMSFLQNPGTMALPPLPTAFTTVTTMTTSAMQPPLDMDFSEFDVDFSNDILPPIFDPSLIMSPPPPPPPPPKKEDQKLQPTVWADQKLQPTV